MYLKESYERDKQIFKTNLIIKDEGNNNVIMLLLIRSDAEFSKRIN